jgi:hypothetical protein
MATYNGATIFAIGKLKVAGGGSMTIPMHSTARFVIRFNGLSALAMSEPIA